ncbi:MAG: hypothetical protein WAL50_08185 [Kineosporiaceae bacterium]
MVVAQGVVDVLELAAAATTAMPSICGGGVKACDAQAVNQWSEDADWSYFDVKVILVTLSPRTLAGSPSAP